MLEVKELSFSFSKKCVLNSVSFTVNDGTVLGVVGINGAGKTTLLRLLSGVYTEHTGELLFDGRKPTDPDTRRDIFFLPDDPYYSGGTTPLSLFELYSALYPDISIDIFKELIAEYSIPEGGAMRNFSKGMRRQVFIALALAIRPKYLLLDEAFDGLDPLSKRIFRAAIEKHARTGGSTVIISSHSLKELETLVDSFILIDNNTVRTEGELNDGGLHKYALAFTTPVDRAMFDGLPVVSLSVRARFVDVTLRGNADDLYAALTALGPAVIDELPPDFEDTFISDVKGGEENA